ncbi:hypothetical protein PN498_23345 [Oscillatoria sp. CS-180]|uniref:hypothetical protein n=1 Tax=Oscillatoria sp. CS-180 TaxID=3021720 RepID=UPI00232CC089|nr:hypothetical protein [Oscillatoria sp. CS-180]MDB9528948.1 hypothetical protein [Oscillatoria sp. CS-180]
MAVYQESGLEVDLPDHQIFRFCDCTAYRRLSSYSLKEMDFGWWDNQASTLWLMELKDYSRLALEDKLPNNLFGNFVDKATDSLMMLAAVWSNSEHGQALGRCLPTPCTSFPQQPHEIKLVFVLKLESQQLLTQLSALSVRLRNRLRGRIALFNMSMTDLILLDHMTAIRAGLPIKIPSTDSLP